MFKQIISTKHQHFSSLSLTSNLFRCYATQTKSSGRWLDRQRRDTFVKQAKAQGYRSRAAFKLLEIDEKWGKFLEKSKVIIDLGAAPGSWSQVAAEKMKSGGKLITIDILDMEPLKSPPNKNLQIIQLKGKFEDSIPQLRSYLNEGEFADCLLSDMAPNTSGVKSLDHNRIIFLCNTSIDFAFEVLKPGGCMLMKIFSGPEDATLKNDLKQYFENVNFVKPASSRSESSEVYVLAEGFKL
ncbi:predicted protein [Naegleria gruberi]|uniref:rRNA methyltransferase 2, mitochondrial n=1 Tax=Naegleria gruberi TaxID=5762 RepID=D2V437_NAEGR|nr:uncharacterized protein NAEGRDRAFT_30825 [Naegleria gruberi]EFC48310.1 predicted protein [Naegleria gruberi]|eukprot:XP_002681054.1 predicted protein [Naegleria gruberi strain NEG-M]